VDYRPEILNLRTDFTLNSYTLLGEELNKQLLAKKINIPDHTV
jgi:hypothetical protein